MGAAAGQLQNTGPGCEGVILMKGRERLVELRRGHLAHFAAGLADQKGGDSAAIPGLAAGDIGVEAGKPMGQSLLDEEVQSTVNRCRWHAAALGRQHVRQIIGPQRSVGMMKGFKNPTADGGHPDSNRPAQALGVSET